MKKLYASIIALMTLVALFSTVAYAWLALATINNIENLSMTATTGEYLQMSLDGKNYSTKLSGAELLSKMKDLKFDAVTSNDGINFSSSYSANIEALRNTDYMSIKIYFRTASFYREVHLSDNVSETATYDNVSDGTYIVSKGKMFKSEVDYLYDIDDYVIRDEMRKHYGADAMRVSFVNNDNLAEAKIFDLSNNEHRGFGKPYGALDYLNKFRMEDNVAPEAPETIYQLSEFEEEEPYAKTDSSKIITLKATDELLNGKRLYKGSVTLNVWLEGWDADAFDGIYNDKLKMQFVFKAVMERPPKNAGDAND